MQDPEALRTLRLLGAHHQRLARVVGANVEPTAIQPDRTEGIAANENIAELASPDTGRSPQEVAEANTSRPVESRARRQSTSPVAQRKLQRETSSSIASNLASARGIPTVQQRAARKTARQDVSLATITRDSSKPVGPRESEVEEARPNARDQLQASLGHGDVARHVVPGSASVEAKSANPTTDAAFQRFYSTFEGLISKISAPLAFAGLPLAPEEVAPVHVPTKPSDTTNMKSSTTVDVNRHFSRAALRAMQQGPGVHDSFYVVPPEGGTLSYAGMLARERKHARQGSNTSERGDAETNEHFVDAHETPQPSVSRLARRVSAYRSPSSNKTFEELEEENAFFRQLADEQSQKLYDFEKNAQSQSAALQQSMRLFRQQPRKSTPEHDKGGDSLPQDVQTLQEEVRVLQQEVEKRGKEIEKLATVVTRYRERWEKLKDQARGRRDTPTSNV